MNEKDKTQQEIQVGPVYFILQLWTQSVQFKQSITFLKKTTKKTLSRSVVSPANVKVTYNTHEMPDSAISDTNTRDLEETWNEVYGCQVGS